MARTLWGREEEGKGGLEIGVLCFAGRNIAACESPLVRNNKAPAISRARRNRARISLCLIKLLQFWGRCDWRVITSPALLPPSAVAPGAISGPDTRPIVPRQDRRRAKDFTGSRHRFARGSARVRKLTRSGIQHFSFSFFFPLTSEMRERGIRERGQVKLADPPFSFSSRPPANGERRFALRGNYGGTRK